MEVSRNARVLAVASMLGGLWPLTMGASPTILSQASPPTLRPLIAESVSPLEPIAPVADDGHRGAGFVRRPPGIGPFPAVVIVHPGMTALSTGELRSLTLEAAQPSRFLAAGYTVAVVTYRSRDIDPLTATSVSDAVAATNHVRSLPFVDARSVTIFGCSGGGDLALEVTAATDVAAVAAEEPATVTFTGILNREFPKAAERFTPRDALPILANPLAYYTPKHREATREKLGRIRAPLLIVQGDQSPINRFNEEVLSADLRAMGKSFEVATYPGEPHCFAFGGVDRPVAALRAFERVETFFRRHVSIMPKPIGESAVTFVPVRQ